MDEVQGQYPSRFSIPLGPLTQHEKELLTSRGYLLEHHDNSRCSVLVPELLIPLYPRPEEGQLFEAQICFRFFESPVPVLKVCYTADLAKRTIPIEFSFLPRLHIEMDGRLVTIRDARDRQLLKSLSLPEGVYFSDQALGDLQATVMLALMNAGIDLRNIQTWLTPVDEMLQNIKEALGAIALVPA